MSQRELQSVGIAIESGWLLETVRRMLSATGRYRPVEAREQSATSPIAVVTSRVSLQAHRDVIHEHRRAGASLVLVLGETDGPRDIPTGTAIDTFVAETKVAALLPAAIVLSAWGLSPVPDRLISGNGCLMA